MEISNKAKDILRYLHIQDWQSEAHHQHQNPCERRYRDIKRTANRLMDRTNSPPNLWLLCLQYVCVLLNHTSSPALNDQVPMTILTGTTPDISMLLQFHWCQKVLFRKTEKSFPSASPERVGYFVGFNEHVGHALTYAILDPETSTILCRSEV